MPAYSDRRKYPRVDTYFGVYDKGVLIGYSQNFSVGGCKILLDGEYPKEQVVLSFSDNNDKSSFSVECKKVWEKSINSLVNLKIAGFRFVNPPDEFRKNIANLIQTSS